MAWAICQKCGLVVNYHNYKGRRLREIRCPRCGGRFRRSTHSEALKILGINLKAIDVTRVPFTEIYREATVSGRLVWLD